MCDFGKQRLKKAITFSYDDGVVQDIRLIELMNKYGLKGTFNLNSEYLGKSNILIRQGMRVAHYKIAPQDVRYVYDGHEVAVHTLTHPRLTELEQGEIIRQVEEDRKNLEELVGYDVVGMAYPCGGVNYDERVVKIIRENTRMQYCRTIITTESFELQKNLHHFHPTEYHLNWKRLMQLGRSFVELNTDEPQIFYIWGHSYELDYDPRNWIRLEEFFEMVSGRDDICYGTNKEILLV